MNELLKLEYDLREAAGFTRQRAIDLAQKDVDRLSKRLDELKRAHSDMVSEGTEGPAPLYALGEIERISNLLYEAELRLSERKRSRAPIFLGEITSKEAEKIYVIGINRL